MSTMPLILFFLSLTGIVGMIWRELVLIRNGKVAKVEHSHPFVPDLQKIRHLTFVNVKKLGYVIVFVTLRISIKFSNFIKNLSKTIIEELKNEFREKAGNLVDETMEKKEVSKYLKVISEYQQKIRKMKHKIKEEEGIE